MGNEFRNTTPINDADARKYQILFMSVGLAIIMAGLWWLYEVNAPYHPELQGSDMHQQDYTDS
tara:strand:- start:110529 stop:110717 length:189 start_codon:yes stop_codon:yes gene_type:complete